MDRRRFSRRRCVREEVSDARDAEHALAAGRHSAGAEVLGSVATITGAYLLGVVVARHADESRIAHAGTSSLGYAFFIPIFFINIGLQARADGLIAALPKPQHANCVSPIFPLCERFALAHWYTFIGYKVSFMLYSQG
jgi:hypothetical protein